MAPDQFRPSPIVTDARVRDAFVAALRDCGTVTGAGLRIGITPCSAYRARKKFPAFAAAWEAALRRIVVPLADADQLEAVLLDRVINGIERRRLYAGVVVDTYREYPERLAIVMLQGMVPERYGKTGGCGDVQVDAPVVTREEFMARVIAAERSIAAPLEPAPDGLI